MTFLTVSYLLQHDRRKFPSSIHFWEFVATALFAVSFLIGGRTPEKTTWCFDEGTNATQDNNSRCAVQGFFFIFFGISLTAWCCVIAYMMFYAIVFNQKIQNLRKYIPFFHIFGWGVPMAFAVAAVATKSVGYGPPLAWCFIHFEGFGFFTGDGLSKDYVFFYIPEAVLFFSILFMFIATVAKIIFVRRNHIAHSSVAKAGSRTFQAQVRILIFIFMVFVICFTIFEWRLQIARSSTVAAVGLQWTYCRIRSFILNQTDPSCLGEQNPARIDYRHTAFESFVLSGIGILIFIGFGADPNIYKHWYKLFRLAYAKEWEKMWGLIVDGKDPFKTSKSRENSNSGSGSKTSVTMSDRTRSSDQIRGAPRGSRALDRFESSGRIDPSDRRTGSDLALISKVNDVATNSPETARRTEMERRSLETKPIGNPAELQEVKTQGGETEQRPNKPPTEPADTKELKTGDVYLL
eukprot:Phypoly_transcript_08156.p1 GENE.Phypoly_transcript_08156~~Phypoly_transcript_08156.p1  ORF type:complete len:491 (+),score=48.49 Phypoly_transcript_08156:83-1474(+)